MWRLFLNRREPGKVSDLHVIELNQGVSAWCSSHSGDDLCEG